MADQIEAAKPLPVADRKQVSCRLDPVTERLPQREDAAKPSHHIMGGLRTQGMETAASKVKRTDEPRQAGGGVINGAWAWSGRWPQSACFTGKVCRSATDSTSGGLPHDGWSKYLVGQRPMLGAVGARIDVNQSKLRDLYTTLP